MSKMLRIAADCAEHKGSRSSSKNGKEGYGSQTVPGDLPPEIWDKVRTNPCYSEEAHHHYARIHVAVAPACNFQCDYCNRKYDCAKESHPGVGSDKLTPEQAAGKLRAVATRIPLLTVLGIVGPGDALANPKTTLSCDRSPRRSTAQHSGFLQKFYIYGVELLESGYRVRARGKEVEPVDEGVDDLPLPDVAVS